MEKRKIEVLAPAGSYESMVAAVNAGADAVYIGGSLFGARAYANNLDGAAMEKAIRYVHLHGRKLYMTVNTLVKEKELGMLDGFLKPFYEAGLDGVIVQDLGVFSYIQSHFPDLPIHASTQMTVTGRYGASMLKKLGAARVVLARELSLEEIRATYEETGMEIEVFVHGALCYCYSGQCLFSSLIGGRSGNRGRCAQTCRLPFEVNCGGRSLCRTDEKYILSLKDLCTLDILPDILEAGASSLKIEGRMKSPRYTAGVVNVYRKYVDLYLKEGRKGYRVDEADRKLLLDLFDRGGQTEGYYRKQNGRDMVVLKEKPAFRETDAKLFAYLDQTYVEGEKKEEIDGEVWLAPGKPAKLTVCADLRNVPGKERKTVSADAFGDLVQEAVNAPMGEERIKRQLEKTGDFPFVFRKLTVHTTGEIFLPVQSLNHLRREALFALAVKIPEACERKPKTCADQPSQRENPVQCEKSTLRPKLCALVNTKEQLDGVLKAAAGLKKGTEPGLYLASESFAAGEWKDAASRCHRVGCSCYLMLPRIFRKQAEEYFLAHMEELRGAGFDAVGVASMEEPEFLTRHYPEIPRYFDHGMYVFNHLAAEKMRELGAARLTVPVELNRREIGEMGCQDEMIVYGRLPMMVSAQCIQKTVSGCAKKGGTLYLKDRMGKEFPAVNQCRFCYNTIYNCSPLSLLENSDEVRELGPKAVRLNFTVEDKAQTEAVFTAFFREYALGEHVEAPFSDFTRGHLKRGVE